MTDDIDALFGGRTPPRTSFIDRVTRPAAPPPETSAPMPMPAAEPAELEAGSGPYKPYGFLPTNTVGEVCEVRSWVVGTDLPQGIVFQYRFLMQVGYIGDETLKLSFPDSVVLIEGKRLTDLRQKLSRRMASFIQQYHPKIWSAPPTGETLVERIEIVRPDTGRLKVN